MNQIETIPLSLVRRHAVLAITAIIIAASCGSRNEPIDRSRPSSPAPEAAARPPAPDGGPESKSGAAPAGARRIVVLGDSLTAGLGLPVEQSYPSLIQQRVNEAGMTFEVVNAGVSGDTSAGGLSRLDFALEGDVRVLIVALGGNDGLRGLPPDQLKANLARIIERARARGIRVILAGMEAPPNYGRDYIVAFHKVYPALAREYKVSFLPFLLDGVAGNQMLNQPDGIHPTADGARMMADHLWAVLKPVLDEIKSN